MESEFLTAGTFLRCTEIRPYQTRTENPNGQHAIPSYFTTSRWVGRCPHQVESFQRRFLR